MKKEKLTSSIFALIVTCAFLFSCSSPEKEGIKVGKKYCNCTNLWFDVSQEQLKIKLQEYSKFVKDFSSYNFQTQEDAYKKIQEINKIIEQKQNEATNSYNDCNKKAEEYYRIVGEKYITNKQKKELYDYAYKNYPCEETKKDKSDKLQSNIKDLESQINNLLQSLILLEPSIKGEKFLKENGKRSSVVTLRSGLQYEILIKGTGIIPTEKDKVKVHYIGSFINGKVFDSSIDRGEPSVFETTGVIKGFSEALLLMPVGSKWKIFIPSNLAYGTYGTRGTSVIGPNEVIIFEIDLIEIEN